MLKSHLERIRRAAEAAMLAEIQASKQRFNEIERAINILLSTQGSRELPVTAPAKLVDMVQAVCESQQGVFTIKDVILELNKRHAPEDFRGKQLGVSSSLRQLNKRGLLEIAKRGSGTRATVYQLKNSNDRKEVQSSFGHTEQRRSL